MKKSIIGLVCLVEGFFAVPARGLMTYESFYQASAAGSCNYQGYILELYCKEGNGCDIKQVWYKGMSVAFPKEICPPAVMFENGRIISCFDPPACGQKESKEDFLCC